jgi:hypothetical protein
VQSIHHQISIYSPHPKELIFVKLHLAWQAAPNSARHAAFAHLPRTIGPLTHNRRYFRALVLSGLNLETLKPADLDPADEFRRQRTRRALVDKMPQMGRNTLAMMKEGLIEPIDLFACAS